VRRVGFTDDPQPPTLVMLWCLPGTAAFGAIALLVPGVRTQVMGFCILLIVMPLLMWWFDARYKRALVRDRLARHPCSACGRSLRDGLLRGCDLECAACGRTTALDEIVPPVQPLSSASRRPGIGARLLGVPWNACEPLRTVAPAEGARLYLEAVAWRWWRFRLSQAGAVLVGLLIALVLPVLPVAFRRPLRRAFPAYPDIDLYLFVITMVAGMGLGALVGHRLWQAARRRVVGARLNRARCCRCGYSLLGLTPINGSIVCPECATDVPLIATNSRPTRQD
jgi:hypothetical protein